jgi:hypothetical protein
LDLDDNLGDLPVSRGPPPTTQREVVSRIAMEQPRVQGNVPAYALRFARPRPRASCVELPGVEFLEASDSDDEDNSTEEGRKMKEKREQLVVQRAKIKDFLFNFLGLDPDDPEDQLTVIAWCANLENTVNGYASMLAQVFETEGSLTYTSLNTHLLKRKGNTRWKGELLTKLAPGSILQYNSAMTYYLRVTGQLGERERQRLIVKGFKNTTELSAKVRGALTEDMVQALINQPFMMTNAMQWLRDALIVLSATGVRQNQLFQMELNNCAYHGKEYGGDVWKIRVNRNFKGRSNQRSRNHDTDMEVHYTNPFWAREIRRIIGAAEKRKKDGEPRAYVCPKWALTSNVTARKAIRRGAKELGWAPQLSWVLHSCRDGAAVDAFLKAAGDGQKAALRAIRDKTGHVTLAMLRHYGIPNEDRLRFQQMKADDAMLRLLGVVEDNVEDRYCRRLRDTRMIKVSGMRDFGTVRDVKSLLVESSA